MSLYFLQDSVPNVSYDLIESWRVDPDLSLQSLRNVVSHDST